MLEGYVEQGDLVDEGPFGDHTGYYTPPEPFPVFHVTALTMRRDAIYPSIVVGKPPQRTRGSARRPSGSSCPRSARPCPRSSTTTCRSRARSTTACIVSIRKAYPGHARKVMHAIWGLGMLSLTKSVVVVDAHVDVHDYEQVVFYAGANVDPARDVVLTDGPADHLDHATCSQFVGGKLGIDATAKLPEEGAREWPPEIEMSAEIVRPRRRGAGPSTGIATDPPARNGSFGIVRAGSPSCSAG